MTHTSQIKYTEYDIHGKGVPAPIHVDELEDFLKKLSTQDTYNKYEKFSRTGESDSYDFHAANSSHVKIPDSTIIPLLSILKKCFPTILFRISGQFIYGPGDGIDEHTNANDPSDVMYITYATGKSCFSYRFSPDDDFIDTYDNINGLTLRAFTATSIEPYTHHKVQCESGYRVSIGLRYVQL